MIEINTFQTEMLYVSAEAASKIDDDDDDHDDDDDDCIPVVLHRLTNDHWPLPI